MKFCFKCFFNVFVIFSLVFLGISFADEMNTWYTDFAFDGGENNQVIVLSGGDTQIIPFYLTNKSSNTISGSFGIVDAIDMGGGLLACKANGQDENFGKYGIFQQTGFLLGGNSTFSNYVSLKFPNWFSGDYLGCIVYTPFGNEEIGHVNTQVRKALFLKAILSATESLYQLKVFPGSRSNSSLANKGEIRFYNENNELFYFKENIETDSGGNAEISALLPDGVYTVVYKGQSHLASFLYNVQIGSDNVLFDFTTGLNLSGVQNYTNAVDDGSRYQIAGDLKNIHGKYDFTVNGNDIAIVTMDGFLDDVEDLDPRDLNGDNAINVSDLAIIGANFEQEDVFFAGHMYNGLR